MSLKLSILGCDSAIPTINQHQTAQLLNVNERFFLIDCGENTQVQLRKHELSFQRIHHVFISHLHGDHYFGLIGLITSMHLLGRKKELHIHAHAPLKEIINIQLSASNTDLNFPLFFHILPEDSEIVLFKDDSIEISNILLNHTISCSGFIFKELKYNRKIVKENIEKYNIPYDKILDLRRGLDYINENGDVISNDLLTTDNTPAKSYAFCSDTRFFSDIISKIRGVDVLYHEATFCHDFKERAYETGHSTTKDAATIAKEANVKRLIIGHYSKRYSDLNQLLLESREIFSNTFLSRSGDLIDFNSI
tara:strand:- start:674 stop:1594 length:921 start_codon:yes stop_codon:yes gene_type:complete